MRDRDRDSDVQDNLRDAEAGRAVRSEAEGGKEATPESFQPPDHRFPFEHRSPKPAKGTTPVKPVPTLDDLAQYPERAAELPPDVARSLLPRCSEELTRLAELRDVLLIAAFANGAVRRDASDRLLDAEAVAAKIGKSRSWLEKNTQELPLRRRVGGEGLWSEREIEAWMRSRPRWHED